MPTLLVLRGNDLGSRFTLTESEIGLGRDISNGIRLHDTEVSRRHAVLVRQGDTYVLRDLDSANGTFVSGQRITEYRLRPGDRIEVGGSILLFTGVASHPDEDSMGRVDLSRRGAARIVHSVAPRPHSALDASFGGTDRLDGTQVSASDGPTGPHTRIPVADNWWQQAEENLRMMYDITVAISQTIEIDELLRRILDLIFDWVSPDRGCILLIDSKTKQFVPKTRRARTGRIHGDMVISQTILDYVLEKREGVITSDATEDLRFDSAASIVQEGVREAICVPMQGRYDVVGAIYIDTSRSIQEMAMQPGVTRFSENHLRLMAAIANQAALAVEDTRYYASAIQAEHLAAVGQTIATISHHIKNILQGIRGGSYLVESGIKKQDWEMIGKGWTIVEKNQSRIGTLVLDMLTLSKERDPEPQPTNLNTLVIDIVELMQQYATEQHVELSFFPTPEMPVCEFDPDGMHKAILNLVTNGIDATSPKTRAVEEESDPDSLESLDHATAASLPTEGHLRLFTEYDASAKLLRVIVDDDGPGIPADQIETLFKPFMSTKKNRGTGLGLPVSEKILREHGGKILVESTVGHGTRFTLQWPAILSNGTTEPMEPLS
ncbi:MAG: FHA domain-containing protein [Thermoguttaceae bacterium]|nr:FHA domain-containing protein [Thermoguttaceae bacterium]